MYKIKFFLLIFFVSATTHLHALECNPSGTQLEMNACARDSFDKADKQLNDAYQQLISKKQKQNSHQYVKALRESQRAWLKFRDAELKLSFSCKNSNMRICWGSMYPMRFFSRKEALTRQRTEQIYKYIEGPPQY